MNSELCALINAIGQVITDNKVLLTELDSAIGDGDHGINMARGFGAVKLKIESWQEDPPSVVLKKTGMTLISTVGGASGPLYGTAFLKASSVLASNNVITPSIYAAVFTEVINGIKAIGKATSGEKTMLDALEPACNSFKVGISEGKSAVECLTLALNAAEDGVLFTKNIRATKGRASYLGDRSIGHADPGATSSMLIIKAILDYVKKSNRGVPGWLE